MRTTIDKAGRLVVPKALRAEIGFLSGEVEVVVDGNALRIEPVDLADPVAVDNVLLLPSTGIPVSADQIRDLRLADQR